MFILTKWWWLAWRPLSLLFRFKIQDLWHPLIWAWRRQQLGKDFYFFLTILLMVRWKLEIHSRCVVDERHVFARSILALRLRVIAAPLIKQWCLFWNTWQQMCTKKYISESTSESRLPMMAAHQHIKAWHEYGCRPVCLVGDASGQQVSKLCRLTLCELLKLISLLANDRSTLFTLVLRVQ